MRSAILVKFPFGQSTDSIKKFCSVAFPVLDEDSFDIKCKMGSENSHLLFHRHRVSSSLLPHFG